MRLEHYSQKYFPIESRLSNAMFNLESEGLSCLSIADIMDKRMSKYGVHDVERNWKILNFSTRDAMYSLPDGRFILSLDDTNLNRMDLYEIQFGSNQSILRNENILPSGKNTILVTQQEVKKHYKKTYTIESAKGNRIWNFLARDHKRLSDYVDWVYSQIPASITNKAMPICLDFTEIWDQIKISSCTLGGVGSGSLFCGKYLGENGLIVGIKR